MRARRAICKHSCSVTLCISPPASSADTCMLNFSNESANKPQVQRAAVALPPNISLPPPSLPVTPGYHTNTPCWATLGVKRGRTWVAHLPKAPWVGDQLHLWMCASGLCICWAAIIFFYKGLCFFHNPFPGRMIEMHERFAVMVAQEV